MLKKKIFGRVLVSLVCLFAYQAFAETRSSHRAHDSRPENGSESISSYKCASKTEIYEKKDIVNVGVGFVESGKEPKRITFCSGRDSESCYATQKNIDDPESKIEYATLLSAVLSKSNIQFYCNKNGFAENIRLIK